MVLKSFDMIRGAAKIAQIAICDKNSLFINFVKKLDYFYYWEESILFNKTM